MLPLAAGQARGTVPQEAIIKVVLRTAAVSLIGAVTFIARGLRASAADNAGKRGAIDLSVVLAAC